MKLRNIELEGYRSIREPLFLSVDPRVSILLGANDHGKSNILAAIEHLNSDNPFTQDDLNWDLDGQNDDFPRVKYEFALSDDDKFNFFDRWEQLYDDKTETFAQAKAAQLAEGISPEDIEIPHEIAEMLKPSQARVPDLYVLNRRGVGAGLTTLSLGDDDLDQIVRELIPSRVPRVELIRPFSELNDTVNAGNIAAPDNEFMQGIFYLAGLNPLAVGNLFTQDHRTTRQLDDVNRPGFHGDSFS